MRGNTVGFILCQGRQCGAREGVETVPHCLSRRALVDHRGSSGSHLLTIFASHSLSLVAFGLLCPYSVLKSFYSYTVLRCEIALFIVDEKPKMRNLIRIRS